MNAEKLAAATASEFDKNASRSSSRTHDHRPGIQAGSRPGSQTDRSRSSDSESGRDRKKYT